MAVSIKDIARIAGVSHSTVSRALRHSPLIPAVTAGRIEQIANELGYTASAIGRGLVKGRTEAIGVVVTSIADPFNGEVVAGLEEVANANEYSVILATSQALPEREISVVKAFQSRRVDGIIVASSRVGSKYSSLLADLQIPVVLLNNQHPEGFIYSVLIDNSTGAFDVTSHLLRLGHRRIAYLGDELGLHSNTERKSGFLRAMETAQIQTRSEYLAQVDGSDGGAVHALRNLWQLEARPTAVVCYNDMLALSLMQAAKGMEISIPQNLSITGFDDIQAAGLVTPGLTTIRQPKKELGARSMSLMLKLLRGEEAERSVVLRGELIERGSSSSPATTASYQAISEGKNSATRSS